MLIWNKLKSLLKYLGFLPNQQITILLLGPPNSGVTTLIYRLTKRRQRRGAVGYYNNIFTFKLENLSYKIILPDYHDISKKTFDIPEIKIDAIILVFDSADTYSDFSSQQLLHNVLTNPAFDNIPVAVLGNKIDLSSAASEEQFREYHGLLKNDDQRDQKEQKVLNHPLKVFMCSLVQDVGYIESIQWLTSFFVK